MNRRGSQDQVGTCRPRRVCRFLGTPPAPAENETELPRPVSHKFRMIDPARQRLGQVVQTYAVIRTPHRFQGHRLIAAQPGRYGSHGTFWIERYLTTVAVLMVDPVVDGKHETAWSCRLFEGSQHMSRHEMSIVDKQQHRPRTRGKRKYALAARGIPHAKHRPAALGKIMRDLVAAHGFATPEIPTSRAE